MYIRKRILPEILTFARAQLSAFVGGIVDFIVMILLTEFAGVFYAYSIIVGGIVGAGVNFSINKFWAFGEQKSNTLNQILKFSLVVAGSILLKSTGTYFLTETLLTKYWISRLVVDAFVCFGFNYVLHRVWVFK